MFSFARYIKEKHKVKNKKQKLGLWEEKLRNLPATKILITELHQVFSVVSGLRR